MDGSGNGNGEDGGAIVVQDSREINISDCQIKNPIFNGIQFVRSTNSQIMNCIISEGVKNNGMLRGITLKGVCTGTMVKDNSVARGKLAEISNYSSGAVVKENISIGSIQ
jgi:parallel beta-helix repeat protein